MDELDLDKLEELWKAYTEPTDPGERLANYDPLQRELVKQCQNLLASAREVKRLRHKNKTMKQTIAEDLNKITEQHGEINRLKRENMLLKRQLAELGTLKT